jgi:hypothetical protein
MRAGLPGAADLYFDLTFMLLHNGHASHSKLAKSMQWSTACAGGLPSMSTWVQLIRRHDSQLQIVSE